MIRKNVTYLVSSHIPSSQTVSHTKETGGDQIIINGFDGSYIFRMATLPCDILTRNKRLQRRELSSFPSSNASLLGYVTLKSVECEHLEEPQHTVGQLKNKKRSWINRPTDRQLSLRDENTTDEWWHFMSAVTLDLENDINEMDSCPLETFIPRLSDKRLVWEMPQTAIGIEEVYLGHAMRHGRGTHKRYWNNCRGRCRIQYT